MDFLIKQDGGVKPYRYDLAELGKTVKELKLGLTELNHTIGEYQRKLNDTHDLHKNTTGEIYKALRGYNDITQTINQNIERVDKRISTLKQDLEMLKMDIVSHDEAIKDRLDSQDEEIQTVKDAFESNKSDYYRLSKNIQQQTTESLLQMHTINIPSNISSRLEQESRASMSIPQLAGSIEAILNQSDISLNIGLSEILINQLHLIKMSNEMNNKFSEIELSIQNVNSNISRNGESHHKLTSNHELTQESVSKLETVIDADGVKLDTLLENYRSLTSEVDDLRLQFNAFKSTSSPAPQGRIHARRKKEVEFNNTVEFNTIPSREDS
jgi:chromosome segregation ATPase